MKRLFCRIVCLFFLLSLTGCADFGYQTDLSFTCFLPQNISTLDPQTASDPASKAVISSLFEGLCRLGEQGEALPGAARRWEANKDATVFTFHLRSGAKWSDGRPVTADDFVFGIARALSPSTGAQGVDDLFIVQNARAVYQGELDPNGLGVSAKDDKTLVIKLEQGYEDFPSLTANLHYMPCNREYFEESEGHYGLSSQYLITNGPFTLSSIYAWNTEYGKRSVSLTRSQNYRGEHAVSPQALSYLIDYDTPVDTDPVSALTSGAADILPLSREQARAAGEAGCELLALNDAVTGLLLNPRAEALKSPFVRELFFKTLDRQDLLSRCPKFAEGEGEAFGIMADCVRWNRESYYQEGDAFYPEEDPQLLNGLSSLLKAMDREKLPSITVICPDDADSVNMANGFLASWNARLRNSFNIEPLSTGEFQERISSGDYEAALYTLQAKSYAPFDTLKAFESAASPSLMEDKEYDAALHSLSFDLSSYRELESLLQESYVFYPIYQSNTYYGLSPAARGITVAPDSTISFLSARKRP